jgi:hypothetical protein
MLTITFREIYVSLLFFFYINIMTATQVYMQTMSSDVYFLCICQAHRLFVFVCCSIFSFLCNVLSNIVCLFPFRPLYCLAFDWTASDYLFGISKYFFFCWGYKFCSFFYVKYYLPCWCPVIQIYFVIIRCLYLSVMVFNATFNTISVITWWSV